MNMKRDEVFDLVSAERDYQNSLSSARTDGSTKSVGDYITMLSYYVNKMQEAWTVNAGNTPALDIMRKCAAIAVHCMEDHGAPSRFTKASLYVKPDNK